MAVPARDVRRPEPAHGLEAQDRILQQFIESGADVDVTVSKRWAIVEHEGRLGGGALLDSSVETVLLPVGDAQRLAFGQAGPHGEIGDG